MLQSADSTMELLVRVKTGDLAAGGALFERFLPELTRWAHGRLPSYARGAIDTSDLVQIAILQLLKRLDQFEPQHVGAMQGYLRRSVLNLIRDEIRRVGRRPVAEEPGEVAADDASPEEAAIRNQTYERYRAALASLRVRDRELIIARVELQWPVSEISQRFGYAQTSGARMAVSRAVTRLTTALSASA
jgi:RNA polymerase sigma factor (sigma-70 family)